MHLKTFLIFANILILVLLIKPFKSDLTPQNNLNQEKKLKFDKNGKFKIVQFTDQHFGENEDNDKKTTDMMHKILINAQPDLVIISGDLVSGYSWDKSSGWQEKHQRKAVQALIDLHQPYIWTLGNHDS